MNVCGAKHFSKLGRANPGPLTNQKEVAWTMMSHENLVVSCPSGERRHFPAVRGPCHFVSLRVLSVLSSSLEVHPAPSPSALHSLVSICHIQVRAQSFRRAASAIPAGPAERKKPPLPSNIVLDSAAAINYANATEPELLPFLFGRPACRAKSSWRITHPAVFLCASAFGFLRRLGSKPSCLINSHFILLARALMT